MTQGESSTGRKLSLDDIADLREYERERDESVARIIALKKRRRPQVGPFVSLLFDNRDTILHQIHEMARAERILTDEGLLEQLDVYNPLIPEPGHLSATLLIELTDEWELREWLPRLVGIEGRVVIDSAGDVVRCMVEESHEAQLTRDDVTAAVHFIGFQFTQDQVARWGSGPVVLSIDHPEYSHSTTLTEEMVTELGADLRDD
ncbi:MAG: DUF3501 family protein [Microthrixaceae bacterium]